MFWKGMLYGGVLVAFFNVASEARWPLKAFGYALIIGFCFMALEFALIAKRRDDGDARYRRGKRVRAEDDVVLPYEEEVEDGPAPTITGVQIRPSAPEVISGR